MNCPRDGQALEEGIYEGRDYQCCPNCSGLWLPLDGAGDLGRKLLQLPDRALSESSKYRHHAPVNCPIHDDELMEQRYIQGIQLDICTQADGLWLDSGEQRYLLAWYSKFKGEAGPVRKGMSVVVSVGTVIEVLVSLVTGP